MPKKIHVFKNKENYEIEVEVLLKAKTLYKTPEELSNAIQKVLKKSEFPIRAFIVGDGEEKQNIINYIKSKNLYEMKKKIILNSNMITK